MESNKGFFVAQLDFGGVNLDPNCQQNIQPRPKLGTCRWFFLRSAWFWVPAGKDTGSVGVQRTQQTGLLPAVTFTNPDAKFGVISGNPSEKSDLSV